MSSPESFNLIAFHGRMRILHLTWVAFFITFVVWFNHAPLLQAIAASLGLSSDEVKMLLTLNVALTIPARIIIGMLTDRYGPRRVYSTLLALCAIPCAIFALADNYTQLALGRFLLGLVGAGFVIGIRMVSEWFPHNEMGLAEGIYGGWGNFGSAAAAMTLPTLALVFGGDDGWRYAVGVTGLIALVYSVVYYNSVSDTPKGSTYFKPRSLRAMEVTSVGDFFLLLAMKAPMYLVLGLLAWKLSPYGGATLLGTTTVWLCWLGLAVIYAYDAHNVFVVNRAVFETPVPELHRYRFKQVAVLNVMYFATFGSELAVVSMLPLFFAEVFSLDPVLAGLTASGYAFMNLVSRPTGGWMSDRFGRKRVLQILTVGLAGGYLLMSQIDASWPVLAAVGAAMLCSFFVQSGEGAVFAVVPLIKRRLTGQIAGMTGAYGNVGAVTYLTVLTLVDYQLFFLFIGATAVIGLIALSFMDEPQGQMAEILEDGTVELIDVA